MAFASTGKPDDAAAELGELKALAPDPKIADMWIWDINRVSDIVTIAASVLEGEIARRGGRTDDAVRALESAVRTQDSLRYDEPPPFHFPVRHLLGQALLDAGMPAEAEVVFREDLVFHPDNGYSLTGLAASLETQGRKDEAAEVMQRFTRAWREADFELRSAWL